MPSQTLSMKLKSNVTLFTSIYEDNQEALNSKELDVFTDYVRIAKRLAHYEQSPGFLTEEINLEISEMIERWKANLEQVSKTPAVRILKLSKRYNAINSGLYESKLDPQEARLSQEIALGILALAQDEDDRILDSTETRLEQLEQSLSLKRAAAITSIVSTPAYVEEIITRAKAHSRAFHFASDQRQRAILRPFAEDVAKKLGLKVEIQTMISTTLQHLKRKA